MRIWRYSVTALLLAAPWTGLAQPVASGPAQGTEQLRRATAALTGQEASDLLTRSFLTGDWGGVRPMLHDRYGITPYAIYLGRVTGNPTGGESQGMVYNGLFDVGVNVNLEKLTDGAWPGATVFANFYQTQGPSLTQRYLGDPFFVSNIDAPDTIRLAQLWFQQEAFDERLSLRVGQLYVDTEFAVSDLAAMFLNGAFSWPIGIGANAPVPAYSVAGLGARLHVKPTPSTYFSAAVFQGNADPFTDAGDPINNYGTYWNLNPEQGIFSVYEVGYHLGAARRPATDSRDPKAMAESAQATRRDVLPGEYKLGAWFHTGSFTRNDIAVDGFSLNTFFNIANPPTTDDAWGLYLVADQMLIEEVPHDPAVPLSSDQGLGAFFRFFYTDPEVSVIDVASQFGLTYTGLLPGRDADTLGVGFSYTGISPSLAKSSTALGGPAYDYAGVLEVSYQMIVAPWLIVQPDVQYLIQPGAAAESSGGTPDAIVLSLQTVVAF